MDDAYARADLVLCRAGATTVAELTAFGKAAILIPYPYAIYDHQRWNAQALADKGAAEMILDHELNGAELALRLRDYLADRKKIEAMAKRRSPWAGRKPRRALSMSVTHWRRFRRVINVSCCTRNIEFILSGLAVSA